MLEGVPPLDRRTPSESGPGDVFDLEPGEFETAPIDERTPKERREILGNLITSAKGLLFGGERAERLTSYLKDRSAKLDANASELGVVEKSFRALGERYNKLGWKSKLGVGLALGIGSAAFSGVSLPIAFACTSGLALQRVAGMASVFLKYEKKGKALGKEGGLLAQKEKAMLKAMLYSAGMSLAIGEAVSLASESSYGEAVHEWLKQNWPSGGSGVQTDVPASHEESLSTETSEPTSEMQPANPVEAPEQHIEAQSTEPDIEPVGNPEVASADTESANLAAKEFGAEYAEPETAPEAAATGASIAETSTPEDLSAKEWKAEYAEPVNHTGAPDWRAEHTESDFVPETPEEALATVDTAPNATVTEEAVAPNAVPADTLSAMPETPPVPTPEANHFVVNTHGLSIDEARASDYLDTQGNRIVYGGSLDERAELAKQWVIKDRSAVVFFDSTRTEKFLGLFNREVPHLSMAQWVDAGAESGVRIAEDTNDPSLVGIMLPTANDLAQVYKHTN